LSKREEIGAAVFDYLGGAGKLKTQIESARRKRMKNKIYGTAAAALLGIAVLIATPNITAKDHTEKSRAAIQQDAQDQGPAKPGPEMQKLQFLNGDWNTVATYPKSALFPDGGEEQGTFSSHPGPGGFSMVSDFKADGLEGPIQGLSVRTWDPRANGYIEYTFGNGFAGAFLQLGHWEGDNLIFEGQFDNAGGPIGFRQSIHADGPDSITLQEWFSQNGGEMQLMQTTKATRK
jgi:hypothetical protein